MNSRIGQRRLLSLSIASALTLIACGGSESNSASQTPSSAPDGQPSANKPSATATKQAGSYIAVVARGALAANLGPVMQVRANGQLIGTVEVRSQTYQTYYFATSELLANGSRVEVSFINDAVVSGADRNLYVQSINVDGKTFASNSSDVRYVRGWDEIAGQEDMLWSGTLRLNYSGNQALTVRARGSLANGEGPLMDVRLNNQSIAKVAVVNTEYDDYTFNLPTTLPPDSKLEIVFSNDFSANGQDRNLYIQSITANGRRYNSTDAGVTFDRGAIDGVDVIAGREDLLWNGGLRFVLSTSDPTPNPTVRPGDNPPAGYTLCATEGQTCSITAPSSVIYGASSTWTSPRSVAGNIDCNNSNFSDNAPGVTKACYVNTMTPPPPPPGEYVIPQSGFHPGLSGPNVYATSELPGASDGTGNFRTVCEPVKMDYVDPIVFPGQNGASHLHTFFGNTGVNHNSTPDTLRSSGNSACRGGTLNRSSYWVPTMIDTRTNRAIMPISSDFYYKTGYRDVRPADVRPFPPGLRMIAGDPRNTAPSQGQTSGFEFVCRNTNTQQGSVIPNCGVGDEVDQTIYFPQCWNGRDVDSPDHKSHMAYAIVGVGCPSSHPVPLPEITYHIKYRITEANQATYWKLSSDRAGTPVGYSSHGDWMNGWDVNTVQTWVTRCLNTALDCHSHLLGDGRAIGL